MGNSRCGGGGVMIGSERRKSSSEGRKFGSSHANGHDLLHRVLGTDRLESGEQGGNLRRGTGKEEEKQPGEGLP